MHLIEQYALSCGVKIDKPSVEVSFFPVPFDKYVVIHPSSGMGVKSYDFHSDVINLIYPLLRKNNVNLVQIGEKKDYPLPHCHHLQGVTSLAQSFYLIKNCELLLGNDSFSTHVASGFDKKIVSLYSTNFKECCGPYWGNTDNQILIQGDLKGKKPSFSTRENNKVVNTILPEEISRSALSLLKIKHDLDSYKTLNIGSRYAVKSIEVAPNFYNESLIPDKKTPLNVRCDYEKIDKHLFSWLKSYKCHLIIDKEESTENLIKFKGNISRISILLNKSITEEYVNSLVGTGLPVDLICMGEKNLKEYQIKFLDYNVVYNKIFTKKDLDSSKEICDNTFFKSSKTIFSNGKTYSSNAHRIKDIEQADSDKIIDSPEFWKDQEYYMIYNS